MSNKDALFVTARVTGWELDSPQGKYRIRQGWLLSGVRMVVGESGSIYPLLDNETPEHVTNPPQSPSEAARFAIERINA